MNIGITELDDKEAHDIEPMTWRGNVFTCMHDYMSNAQCKGILYYLISCQGIRQL